ncbi:putative pentatricopeptide repeat-containing protein At5g52630 [Silene latifolia]|uniref:putative pentatricopeptide repeat-containing protein At5g52630 n=1 Tax=Silene latifolia TaxID=37657 RepID=UPI003D784785
MYFNLRLRHFSQFSRAQYLSLRSSSHSISSSNTRLQNNRRLAKLSKSGKLDEAHQLFVKMPERDEFTWNIMVSGYANSGRFTLAREFFDQTPCKTSITWNSLISGYCRYRYVDEVFDLFWEMQYDGFKPTEYTVGSVLGVCSQLGLLSWGKQLHCYALKTQLLFSSFVATCLVDMYAKSYCILEAECVFNLFTGSKTHVLWTAMLTAYSYNECGCKPMECFRDMRVEGIESNQFTFPSILKACATDKSLIFGQQVHGCLIKYGLAHNDYTQCALVDMYAKCKDFDTAKLLLETTKVHTVTAWNSLLISCLREGFLDEAMLYFKKMHVRDIKVDDFTFPTILKCFASQFDVEIVESIHCLTIKTGYEDHNPVSNALVDVYGKCGNLDSAIKVFIKLSSKDVVSWTSLINSYSQNGFYEKALELFSGMRIAGICTDEILFSSMLRACAELTLLGFAKQVHAIFIKARFGSSLSVDNSLITLYSKCGCIDEAVNVFSSMLVRDLISWTSIIVGFAQNGLAMESIKFYERMLQSNIKPDFVTFIGLLFACSHAGLHEKGKYYFESMDKVYGIKPGLQHYACMIDLLGRSGKMAEIRDLLKEMEMQPDTSIWKAVLGASRVHQDIEMAKIASKNLFELEPENAAPYILLANLYSTTGRWEEAARFRTMMKTKAIIKAPGCSWTAIEGKVHTFVSSDRNHPRIAEIYSKVHEIIGVIKKTGYKPDMNFALHDMDEEGKELGLVYHSEKLAVAFGLLVLPPGLPIRVFKNIRVCGDCHNAMKLISKAFDRHIVLRDSNRFHHFKGGICSCNDYW